MELIDLLALMIDAPGLERPHIQSVRDLWMRCQRYELALEQIRDWDLGHSEALSAGRAVELASDALVG